MTNYWLFKTEPETYSLDQLKKDKKTGWDGVRNFQARNFLNECATGDEVLIYHSGKDKSVVGTAKVVKTAYPDPDPKKKGDWVQVDIQYGKALQTPVTLKELKSTASLKELMLIRQGRLSVMPVKKKEFDTILKMGGK